MYMCFVSTLTLKHFKRNIYKPPLRVFCMKNIKQTLHSIYNKIAGLFQPRYIDVEQTNKFIKRGITPFFILRGDSHLNQKTW